MSIKIMTHIFDSEVLGPTQRLILLSLADHADDTGRCYPSIARLCKRTGLSERAVRSNIRALESEGYLTVHLGAGQGGSNVYFVRATPAADAPRQEMPPGTKCTPPGQEVPPTPAADASKPSITINEPSVRTPLPPKKASGDFEAFYAAFPRKKDPDKARAAYARAVKKVSPEVLLSAAISYAQERDGQDPKYTKHPTSWLNAGSWANQPDQTQQDFHNMISQALGGPDAISGPRENDHGTTQRLSAPLQATGTSGPERRADRTAGNGRGNEQSYADVIRPRRFGGADY